MKTKRINQFYFKLVEKKKQYPWHGHLLLTYRCNLNCIHCYCKGSETKDEELTSKEWKKIIDDMHKEGCLQLTLSGGEPLLREDFLDLYAYAKEKGFIITLFSNGLLFTKKIFRYLKQFPPYVIEITLNGISQKTYESITRIPGSFFKAMETIKKIAEKKLPLILKSNCLKQNKHEIAKIKKFVDTLLGKANAKYHYKYDPMIYPQLNRNTAPCQYRLTFDEIEEMKKQDSDMWNEYQRGLCSDFPDLTRDGGFLYQCNSWMTQFLINPFGRLMPCLLSEKFSVNLRTDSFKKGFYTVFPLIFNEQFKTSSKCKDCTLRPICYHCPARAYLETGDEEAPIEYYCRLAKEMAKQMPIYQKKNSSVSFQPAALSENQ